MVRKTTTGDKTTKTTPAKKTDGKSVKVEGAADKKKPAAKRHISKRAAPAKPEVVRVKKPKLAAKEAKPEAVGGEVMRAAIVEHEKAMAAPKVKPPIDQFGRSYATGRRKESVARVYIKLGKGSITVNGLPEKQYFTRPVLRMLISQPFLVSERMGQFDVICTVDGGGSSGQAGAVRHGISKALVTYEPALRPVLKSAGLLTRDSREVERKKYGRRKARRRFQFSKR